MATLRFLLVGRTPSVLVVASVLTRYGCQAFSLTQRHYYRSRSSAVPRWFSTKTPQETQMTQDGVEIVNEAIRAVNPVVAVKTHLRATNEGCLEIDSQTYRIEDYDRLLLIAFGKASSAMATAVVEVVEKAMPTLPMDGVVIVKDGHATPDEINILKRHDITIQEASHPVPDERSVHGATQIVHLLSQRASPRTLVLCCISGGGSALCCAPKPPLTLADLQNTNEALLNSGLAIQSMNVIRKRLELAKGGRLAIAAYPSTCITLILSDILGDPLDLIASGPTVPDTSMWQDAWQLVESNASLQKSLPPAVLELLRNGANDKMEEDYPEHAFDKCHNVLVGNNELAVTAAAQTAERLGYHPVILGTMVEGEARHVAGVYAAMAQYLSHTHNSNDTAHSSYTMTRLPAAIIGGGETTVTLPPKNSGKGGRNQELALAAALHFRNYHLRNVVLASVGTDGTDGPTDAAGAIVDGGTVERLDATTAEGSDSAEQALQRHDAYTYFAQDDTNSPLIMTGPTGTNVADVCVTLIQ